MTLSILWATAMRAALCDFFSLVHQLLIHLFEDIVLLRYEDCRHGNIVQGGPYFTPPARFPLIFPLSQLTGTIPAKAHTESAFPVPNSGQSVNNVRTVNEFFETFLIVPDFFVFL
ncbi:hypothetical protein FACS189454_08190 [Planctomycetales bacterium]|nr:hypothetical protein FACS189454_08190 [Planctomycetales bacterium]